MIFKIHSIHSPIWEFSGEKLEWLKGNFHSIHSLSTPPKSGRNTNVFNEIEVKNRFYPYLEKIQIKDKVCTNKIIYFFPL